MLLVAEPNAESPAKANGLMEEILATVGYFPRPGPAGRSLACCQADGRLRFAAIALAEAKVGTLDGAFSFADCNSPHLCAVT